MKIKLTLFAILLGIFCFQISEVMALVKPSPMPNKPPTWVEMLQNPYSYQITSSVVCENDESFMVTPIEDREYPSNIPIIILHRPEPDNHQIVVELHDITNPQQPVFCRDISFCCFNNRYYCMADVPRYNLHLKNGRSYQVRIYQIVKNTKKLIIQKWVIKIINKNSNFVPPR